MILNTGKQSELGLTITPIQKSANAQYEPDVNTAVKTFFLILVFSLQLTHTLRK